MMQKLSLYLVCYIAISSLLYRFTWNHVIALSSSPEPLMWMFLDGPFRSFLIWFHQHHLTIGFLRDIQTMIWVIWEGVMAFLLGLRCPCCCRCCPSCPVSTYKSPKPLGRSLTYSLEACFSMLLGWFLKLPSGNLNNSLLWYIIPPPNIKHPLRNQGLVGNFHIIGTISQVFNIRGVGLV